MDDKKQEHDFSRWAITGVITPFAAILILTFVIAPLLWPDLASSLGNALGYVLIGYLMVVAVAATIWKIRRERKEKKKGT